MPSIFSSFFGAASREKPTEAVPFDWSDRKDDDAELQGLIHSGQLEAAEQILLKLQRAAPRSRVVLTQLAAVAEMRGDWSRALHWWSSIRVEPRDIWQTDVPTARILARQGKFKEALPLLLKAVANFDDNNAVLYHSAIAALSLDRESVDVLASQIRPRLLASVSRDGETSETLVTRGRLAAQQGLLEEAYDCMRQAHWLRPLDLGMRGLAVEAGARLGFGEDDLRS